MSERTEHGATASQAALVDRLVARDRDIARSLADLDELQRRLTVWLEPTVTLRRLERDHLRRKLETANARPPQARAHAQIDALEQELAAARFEIVALRQSSSWRLTAPLRWVYRRLTGQADQVG